jgi:hypothetical protein
LHLTPSLFQYFAPQLQNDAIIMKRMLELYTTCKEFPLPTVEHIHIVMPALKENSSIFALLDSVKDRILAELMQVGRGYIDTMCFAGDALGRLAIGWSLRQAAGKQLPTTFIDI